jgi:hypothetical protein
MTSGDSTAPTRVNITFHELPKGQIRSEIQNLNHDTALLGDKKRLNFLSGGSVRLQDSVEATE